MGKTIHSRKEPHVIHEELVQVTKWKLIRGKNRKNLLDLVRINTELAVSQATKKAFKKVSKDLNSAISALTNLKGIGVQTASAVLCAGYPEYCPFMADEAMLATPGVEASDYTHAEFVNFATQIKSCTDKLKELDPETKWTPHKVELTLWTHAIAKDLKPAILSAMPLPDGSPRQVIVDDEATSPSASTNTDSSNVPVNGTNGNGKLHNGTNGSALDEDSNNSGPASVSGDEKSNDDSSSGSTPVQGEGDDSSQSVEFRTPHQLSSPNHLNNNNPLATSNNGNSNNLTTTTTTTSTPSTPQQHQMTQHNSVTTASNGSNSSCSSTNATNGSNSNHGNGNSLGSGEESLEGDNSRNVPTLFSAESNGDASNLSSIIDEASASSIASLGTNTADSTSIPDSVTSKVALTSSTAGDLASHEPALKKIRAE